MMYIDLIEAFDMQEITEFDRCMLEVVVKKLVIASLLQF